MDSKTKVMQFMVGELIYQLQTEQSYNMHLLTERDEIDDFYIAVDKAYDMRTLH